MEIRINSDKFSNILEESLESYGQNILNAVDTAGKEASKNCTKNLRAISPKETGAYRKSWTVKRENSFGETAKYTVHAGKHYRRTHLLENGHLTRNGKRVKGIPHISIAEKAAVKEYEQKIKEGIRNVSI